MRLNKDTKFFAAPNSHLIWTVYTGLPVQSIAPVRRQFLNDYRGDVFYIDSPDWDTLSREEVEDGALREGHRLTPESAEQCLRLLRTRLYRETMLRDVGADGRVTTGAAAAIRAAAPERKRAAVAGCVCPFEHGLVDQRLPCR